MKDFKLRNYNPADSQVKGSERVIDQQHWHHLTANLLETGNFEPYPKPSESENSQWSP